MIPHSCPLAPLLLNLGPSDLLLLMDEILHHLGALKYGNSQDFRDLRWCKIPSINSMLCQMSRAKGWSLIVRNSVQRTCHPRWLFAFEGGAFRGPTESLQV